MLQKIKKLFYTVEVGDNMFQERRQEYRGKLVTIELLENSNKGGYSGKGYAKGVRNRMALRCERANLARLDRELVRIDRELRELRKHEREASLRTGKGIEAAAVELAVAFGGQVI